MIPEAEQGRYTIGAKTDKGEKLVHGFDIKEYGGFRPRSLALESTFCPENAFELGFFCSSVAQVRSEGPPAAGRHHPGPRGDVQDLRQVSVLSHPTGLWSWAVCGHGRSSCSRYTYGKPVIGSVKADFCRDAFSFDWLSRKKSSNICRTYRLTVCGPGAEIPSRSPLANFPPDLPDGQKRLRLAERECERV